MLIIDNRTREEILQDGVKHAAHVCRKHAFRDFAEQNAYIRSYDNATIAKRYAVLAFRRAAELHPQLRCSCEHHWLYGHETGCGKPFVNGVR